MSVTFDYPTTGPTNTITLRNPQLGDSNTVDIKTAFKRSMEGTMHSTIKTPANESYTLEFVNITRALMLSMISFMNAAAGSVVRYTDPDSATHDGYILTNPLDFSNYANTCVQLYSFSIEFKEA